VTVLPRISTIAGFELGTGVFVNTVDPSTAAAQLRAAWSAS
jgi:galactose-1-phosphate uridylyltransferase